MKHIYFLSLLLFSCVWYPAVVANKKIFTAQLKNKNAIDIVRLEADDKETFARGKEIFIKSFAEAYKEYTPEQLFLENKSGYLKNFLAAAFEDEENDFNNKKKDALFVVAKNSHSNEVIGFVAYDVTETPGDRTIYIRQLAIDPAYKNQGVGKVLVLDTINMLMHNQPTVVTVCTRKINEPAISFYQKLNFQDASMKDVHPELPEYKYRGFKLKLNGNKNS